MTDVESTDYLLKSKDKPLISFEYFPKGSGRDPSNWIGVKDVYTENIHLMPKDLVLSSNMSINVELSSWFEKRKVPIERKYVEEVVKIISDPNDPLRYIKLGRGLSLNDAYWVSAADDPTTWKDCNLYTNRFNELVSNLVFAGKNAYKEQNKLKRFADYVKKLLRINNQPGLKMRTHISSPEFTTNGNMRKCWVSKPDGIYLRKAEDPDMSWPDGRSPVTMEYYAYQVAEAMGIPYVPYTLSRYKHEDGQSEIVCECPLFTSEDVGFVSALSYFKNIDLNIYNEMMLPDTRIDIELHKRLSKKFCPTFYADMMIFDAIILNNDRHFKNFGYLVNNNTGEYLGPAPLFDNGSSLFWSVLCDFTIDNILQYFKFDIAEEKGKYLPFNVVIDVFMSERHIPMLEKLLFVEFKQPPDISHGISATALETLNYAIQQRSQQILDVYKQKKLNKSYSFNGLSL